MRTILSGKNVGTRQLLGAFQDRSAGGGHVKAPWQPLWIGLVLATLGVACAVPTPRAISEPGSAVSTPQKRLRLGIVQEPKGWGPFVENISTSGGTQQPPGIMIRTLTIVDSDGIVQPVIAEAL